MSYIKIENISKSYKNKKIFDGLSLEIDKNKFISIVGPYGSGKTTLLKTIAGIEKIEDGNILINGCSPEIIKSQLKMGFVFQEPMLLAWRKVIDNIMLPLEIQGNKDNKKAMELLKTVELEKYANFYPKELSGGMQRIVSILRTAILEPIVMLLDEPLSSVDEINRDDLHEKLIKIHNDNKQTTILVTHSIHEAVYLSDEIYLLGGTPTRIIKKFLTKNPRKIEAKFSSETMNQVAQIREELRKAVNNA